MIQMIHHSSRTAIISGVRHIGFPEMLRRITMMADVCQATPGSRTLIVSENREGWIYAFYALWVNQGVVVPVDAASTVHDIAYIMSDCRPRYVWTSLQKEALVRAAIEESGVDVTLLLIDDYECMPLQNVPEANLECNPENLALICYTSGTTGAPKGVMLSFRNILANVYAVCDEIPIFRSSLRTLILLPLHHVLPLLGSVVAPMYVGGGVAISPSLAAQDIMRTLKVGKVGIIIGVPRLWQTLYRGIKGKIDQSAVARALFRMCENAQCRWLSRLVFRSVRTKMGGHLTWCVCGGAALDSDTAMGLKTLGLDVLEGYGMTEAAPMICFTRPGDIIPGCAGLPMDSVEVKIVDGEILARGNNIMVGYYNRPEETAQVIDREGFLHTGDLGKFDDKGRVIITGRKKEIIVLSNGKNVNPVEIEEKLELYATQVKEAAVVPDGDMLKAIIVPQDDWAGNQCQEDMENKLKAEVLQPYNKTVAPYKKVMSLFVYRGELPRTRMEKLKRYCLPALLEQASSGQKSPEAASADVVSPEYEEYQILKEYIQREKKCDVRPTDHLETDLAFDSLDKVALQGFLEQTFGVKLTTDMLSNFPNIQELAVFLYEYKTHVDVNHTDWQELLGQTTGKVRIPRMDYSGFLFTRLCRMVHSLCFHVKVKGLEHVPVHGPYILAPNHQSYLDAPLVVDHLPWHTLRNVYFYAKKDHVRGWFARFLARRHNVIVMDMDTLKDSILMMGEVLRQGRNLVIFPEGTRCRNGNLGEFKKTFAILSRELGVPVIPVCIKGAYEAWPRSRKLPRFRHIEVEYLPAVWPDERGYEDIARDVRDCIAERLN